MSNRLSVGNPAVHATDESVRAAFGRVGAGSEVSVFCRGGGREGGGLGQRNRR
jgi:hypothetical protein